MSAPAGDPLEVLAMIEERAWLVGGALRDRLLDRPTADYDVAIAADPRATARELARRTSGHPFELSEGFGAWRVVSREHTWQVDVLPVAEGEIEADLGRRDLTINAIAQPLRGGELIDPFGGLPDLRARRLRLVSPEAFSEDPLRTLRLVRLACELDFSVEPRTAAAAKRSAQSLAAVSPERVFSELKRIVCAERAVEGLALMDELGITPVVLPEVSALHGVEQSHFHHLDVHDHTLAVLSEAIALERDPERFLGAHWKATGEFMSRPLANELTRWQALRFGALLHDIAKPQTRNVTAQGRVTFMGHDRAGAAVASEILGRLRASERLRDHVAALARHHLRLGFLVHEMPLGRRAIYDYLHTCAPVGVDVTLLSVADRLATRGDNAQRAIARHLQLARQLLAEGLAWMAQPPRPPVRGDELARALGIKPGPVVGGLLAELEAASFSGELTTAEEAIAHARQLIAQQG